MGSFPKLLPTERAVRGLCIWPFEGRKTRPKPREKEWFGQGKEGEEEKRKRGRKGLVFGQRRKKGEGSKNQAIFGQGKERRKRKEEEEEKKKKSSPWKHKEGLFELEVEREGEEDNILKFWIKFEVGISFTL